VLDVDPAAHPALRVRAADFIAVRRLISVTDTMTLRG